MKNSSCPLLTSGVKLKPGRELVFPPAGGIKGVKAVASMLSGRDEELPVVLLDSDVQGRTMAEALRKGLYSDKPDLIVEIETFAGFAQTEVEDLIPSDVIARQLDRWQRNADMPFADEIQDGQPIVPQIESWAERHGVALQVPGWKVELAKRVKQHLLSDGHEKVSKDFLDRWTKLFQAFRGAKTS